MPEFHVELGCRLETDAGEIVRDIDLLENFGVELEAGAGTLGPATAIHDGRYFASLTVDAETSLEAGAHGVEVFVEAMSRALATRGEEIESGPIHRFFDRIHVDASELVSI